MVFHTVSLVTLGLAMLVGAPSVLDRDTGTDSHVGTVVSMTGDQLVMKSQENGEHSHTVAPNARVTLDGKVVKASALKSGTRIRVTQNEANGQVNRIEALDRNGDFSSNGRDGKLVSVNGTRLVMTCEQNKEHSHPVAANAKVTLDGKVCKASDLKPGTRIRVTTDGEDNGPISRIEAIERNAEFAGL